MSNSTKGKRKKRGQRSEVRGQKPKGAKSVAAIAAAEGPASDIRPLTSGLVHSDRIRELTGLDEPALRRLAAKGVIPRPKISKWPFAETIKGLFEHLKSEVRSQKSELPVFDSMEACEGAGLLSKSFLQTLKSFGLPGFENSRVDLNELIPQIETFLAGSGESQAELKAESVASFKEMREKYSARISKIEFQESQGEVISKNTAVDTIRELLVIHHHSYGRMIEEWPNVLAGQGAPKIRTHISKAVEMLKASEAASINGLEKAKGKRQTINHKD